ncbi:hypothetical protein IPG36_05290 [bacterium]|nr:MAG: hypothetical protein IPG36_05290 [bacterium]
MVIGAGTLTAILSHAYSGGGPAVAEKLPQLTTIQQPDTQSGLVEAMINTVIGFLKAVIESAAKPFLDALAFFTKATPLMADNSSVFNLWLTVVGIADALFVLVVALLGFHVMSFATFGLEEIEFKHVLPRAALVFLLINTSIFVVDAVISLSNAMVSAVNAGTSSQSLWDSLTKVVSQPETLGLAGLLVMLAFVVLSIILIVYYVIRLVTLYIGAVLAPIVFMLWLLPGFKDFAEATGKTYLTTVFVLFIHVVIIQLAASLVGGVALATPDHALDPLMSMVIGIATIMALLKTQSVLMQLSFVSLGPKTATMLGGQLGNAISYYSSKSNNRAVPGDSTTSSSRNQPANSNSQPNNSPTTPTRAKSDSSKRPGKTRVAPIEKKGES